MRILVYQKSGNKIDLVIRIINSNDYEKYVLHIIGSAPEYVVSDKGKMWLKQHEDLLQLSQNYQLDPNRYVEIRNELTQKLENIQFENIAVIQTQEIIKRKT